MFHPISDLCGESTKNVEGNLGEGSEIDVIGHTEVNQGLRSGEMELAQGDVIRLKCLGLSILHYLSFKEALIVDLEKYIFSICVKFLEVCESVISSSATVRPHPAFQELLILTIVELILSQILMIWRSDQQYIVANGKHRERLGLYSQDLDYLRGFIS